MTAPSSDIQQQFYESGYAGSSDARGLINSFEHQGQETRTRRIIARLGNATGHLLDVGCGSGPLLYLARKQFTVLTGVDIAEAQLARARVWSKEVNCPLNLHQCNVDTAPLPLADSTVDATVCVVVLELVVRPDYVVAEIARTLRPGGVFIGSVGNIVSWKNRLRVGTGLLPETTRFMQALNGGALHTFTQKTFVGMIQQTGLVVESVGCSGRFWQFRQNWPALLGGDIIVRARKAAR
ncbi:MAG: class I SAM-dependent methyltransferase [Lacunisphaera sp.]|nr:class I SAM-dependent methyltransferase [Lacunisphaera sp.]